MIYPEFPPWEARPFCHQADGARSRPNTRKRHVVPVQPIAPRSARATYLIEPHRKCRIRQQFGNRHDSRREFLEILGLASVAIDVHAKHDVTGPTAQMESRANVGSMGSIRAVVVFDRALNLRV
jgi:hypothetical protein